MLLRTKENTFTAQLPRGKDSIFLKGTTLLEILEYDRPTQQEKIVLAKVNHRLAMLRQKVEDDCEISWLTKTSQEGIRSYQQTLSLVFLSVTKDLLPESDVYIDHSLENGLYCILKGNIPLSVRIVKKIKAQMEAMIQEDKIIVPKKIPLKDALIHLKKQGEKPAWHLGNKDLTYLLLYRLGEVVEYLLYPPFPSTRYLANFDLVYWPPGMILRFPDFPNFDSIPPLMMQKKLFKVFQEYGQWEKILGIQKVSDLNEAILSKEIFDLIKIAEGLHEKKITSIADIILEKKKNLKLALIAGPSSSGKTTFAKRLLVQLKVNEMKPLAVSLDDYFLDRKETPRDENGNYDFESLKAIDVARFNNDLKSLLNGNKTILPIYDFKEGIQTPGLTVQLGPDQLLMIEGLHCLNERLTEVIPKQNKLKIYTSDLTQLNITNHLRVSTSDVRLLRRIIRGYRFRGHSASHTLENWLLVRQGEEKYIFPFQEQADIIFNSSLMYELSILRVFTKKLLEEIPPRDPTYSEAQRLLDLILHFLPISPKEVPTNSILREFIGGSSFHY
jgi:uridine kinase